MTAAEALALARAALEDDKRATPGPWHHDDVVLWACITTKRGGAGAVVATCTGGDTSARDNAASIAAARTREPALARWVEAVLTIPAIGTDSWADVRCGMVVVHPICDGAEQFPVTAREARVLAAALLRAADDAERKP